MTFLADLSNLHYTGTYANAAANRQLVQNNTFCGDVFGKLAGTQSFNAQLFHFTNAFSSQQGNLTMPVAGVSIAFQAEINNEITLWFWLFYRAFLFAAVDCDYFGHDCSFCIVLL